MRNSVGSVSPIGSGSSTRSTAPGSSARVIRTGESRLLWRFRGYPARGRHLSCAGALLVGDPRGGSFESSWPRQESETRRLEVSTTTTPPMRCSRPWTTSPELASLKVPPAHRPALCRWWSRSGRDRRLPGRALPRLGPRPVDSPGRGGRWSLHRSNRWACERPGRRAVFERSPARSATGVSALPGAFLTQARGRARPSGRARPLRSATRRRCPRAPPRRCPRSSRCRWPRGGRRSGRPRRRRRSRR